MKQAWALAIAGSLYAPSAMAGDLPSNMDFWNSFSSADKGYDIARREMNETVFKDSPYDMNKSPPLSPMLSIATYDLNGDGTPEILAMPIDDYEEGAPPQYCKEHDICPYYILQTRGKTVFNLGIIDAGRLDHGDKKVNGYQTLHAYETFDPSSPYQVYFYSPETKGYVPDMTKAPQKPNAKGPA